MKIGNKIVIVGVSAVGKSTFARKLAERTGLPLTHMDTLMWQPGWQYVGDDVAKQKLQEVIATDEWILEGFLEKDWLREVLIKADCIIYLNYSRFILLKRYLQRSWQHRKDARPELPGSPDRFSLTFLLRILQKREMYWPDKEIETGQYDVKLTTLHTPAEATAYLKSL